MQVLIADRFPGSAIAELTRDGFDVTFEPQMKGHGLAQAVVANDTEVLVVRSTPVKAQTLAAGRLRLVVRAGAGFDTIDIEAAKANNVYVANCLGKNATAVAELSFGLVLSLDRRIPDSVVDLRRGVWDKTEYSDAQGLFGRTLGLIGLGAVGREMVPRAQAFGMPVVAWSRSLTPARAGQFGIEHKMTPHEVASASDIVSVHVALTDETRNLIDVDFFHAMRPGSVFINTSRAEIVDEDALVRAVKEKGIRAGLDVFAGQPSGGTGTVQTGLFSIDGIIGTHHIGASTSQAQQAIAQETLRVIREYRETGRPPNLIAGGV
jgi:D-3-phosphoglycerate dehydrogenase